MNDSASLVDPDLARLAAREQVLRLAALAASDPASARFERAFDGRLQELARAAGRFLAADPECRPPRLAEGEEPPEELDLDPQIAALGAPREQLVRDHERVFGLVVSKACPPYEVQYCPQTFSIFRSQQMADVAGFYRAFGVEPGRDAPERVDHVACELEFLAWLAAKERHARNQAGEEAEERAAVCLEAHRDFLSEHVAWWVPAFARALDVRARALAPLPALHAALGQVLARLIPLERALLGVAPPTRLARPRPDAEETGGDCSDCKALEGSERMPSAPARS